MDPKTYKFDTLSLHAGYQPDKLDKSVISYPCDEACMERFEAEKERQQSVIIQTE